MKHIKVPTQTDELLVSESEKHEKTLQRYKLCHVRAQKLERQRNDLLRKLEEARSATVGPIPSASAPRARLKGDSVRFIFGDLHGLHFDPGAFAAMLGDLKRFNPNEIIFGGDGVNCGGFLAQHHTLGYIADTEETYEDDIACANGQWNRIQETAGNAKIEWLEGNHEDRVERWAITETLRHRQDADFLRRLVAPETLLNLKKRGIAYYRRGVTYDGLNVPGWIKRGKVYFTHQMSSAKNAAAASVANTGGNLVYFHTHRQDFSPLVLPGLGLIAAWCPGCLCLRQPLWRHSIPTHWTHGYAVQLVSRTGSFLHINVLIEDGRSLVGGLLK